MLTFLRIPSRMRPAAKAYTLAAIGIAMAEGNLALVHLDTFDLILINFESCGPSYS
jgi:hypothetical protein